MRLRPVVAEPGVVVDAVAASLGRSVILHSELEVDVFRLRPANREPDLVARVFGPDVDRTTLAAAVLQLPDTTHRPSGQVCGLAATNSARAESPS